MVDIHAHILPGLDDGADRMEESLEMAETALRSGTELIAATPHCNIRGYYENYEDSGECREIFGHFRRTLELEGLPLAVVRGMEIFGVGDIKSLIQQRRLISLNHTGNYLIEFPFDMHPDEMSEGLFMVLESGGTPVLAHPERYYCVQDSPDLVYRWVQEGVLTQLNGGSFLAAFGRREERTAHLLLEHGLVSCVASDCHGIRRRSPDLSEAERYVRRQMSRETAELLFCENPRSILSGGRVQMDEMTRIRDRRWFIR